MSAEMQATGPDQPVRTQRDVVTLLEALPYIREFHGKTVVIKYGGAMGGGANLTDPAASGKIVLADPQNLSTIREGEDAPIRVERVPPAGAEDAMLERLCGSR